MKSSRISRVVQLLTALQSDKNYSVDKLAGILKTSRRTVFRDLKELQTIGVPYRFNSEKGGYTMDPDFFLPPVDLNLTEALSLLLIVHKARGSIGFPFKNAALLGALKIENNLPARIRDYCNTALENISTSFGSQAATSKLDKLFASLQKAIGLKQKTAISYDSFFDKEVLELELQPFHLFYNKRAWYVIGYSSEHKSIRTFKLNRILEIELLDKKFIDGDDFELSEYLNRAWSMIPEGRIYQVRLRFLPKVAKNVAEVQWHCSQKVNFNDDGSAEIEFRVNGINEIAWWIMGYGDQVQVLSPKVLRKKIVSAAQRMIELNSD